MPATAPHNFAGGLDDGQPVRPGDVVVFSGTPHLVASTDQRTKDGNPIAKAADGWGIALHADGTLRMPSSNERWCVIHTEVSR